MLLLRILIFQIILLLSLAWSSLASGGNISVATLAELNEAVGKSGNTIRMKPGRYDLKELPGKSKGFAFSGSDNTVILKGVYVVARNLLLEGGP